MREALEEARQCAATGDVPVGAVATVGREIIARGRNRREERNDPTAHAELIALRGAGLHLGSWRLNDVTLFCTLEPCLMCAGAMIQSRLGTLVFGAYDAKMGAAGSVVDAFDRPEWNHRVACRGGVLLADCEALLTAFFAQVRRQSAAA